MKKILGAAALGVALAASSVTAAEAAPKTFKVSIKTSKSTTEVGQKVKISGKVSGASSKSLKGKKVTVQRKNGTGKWARVGTAKIKSGGKYSLTTKLVKGGNTSFRVIKSKSGKIRSGVSAVRTLKVYKWIDLTSAPHFSFSVGAKNTSVTMRGKTYPKALQSLDGMVVIFKSAKACTTVTAYTGYRDKDKAGADPSAEATLSARTMTGDVPRSEAEFFTTLNQVAKRTVSVTGSDYVQLEVDADDGAAVLAAPQVRCNLDTLPRFDVEDLGFPL